MKFLKTGLSCLLFIIMCSSAHALTKEFGPDFSRFSIDIPNNWTDYSRPGGVLLMSPDRLSEFGVIVEKNHDEADTYYIINKLVGAYQFLKDLSIERTDSEGNTYKATASLDGRPFYMLVYSNKDTYAALTVIGYDAQLRSIYSTVTLKD